MKATKIIGLFLSFLIVSLPVCFANSLSLTYDANGNLVTGDGLYREYNSLNQLWKVRNGSSVNDPLIQEYTYHPTEERVLIKKSYNSSGNITETVYYVNDNLVRIVNATGTFDTVYVKHEGQLVAEVKNDSSKLFYHPDHLGSTTLITDETGKGVENTSYTPYGVIIEGGDASRYQYEGKEYDSKIGQYDFHFRGYKADWGKFTQPDTLLPNVYDPQQLNRYAFERNNPWNKIDPSGHYLTGVLAVVAIIIVVWLMIFSEPLVETQKNEKDIRDNLPEYTQDSQSESGGKKIPTEPAVHAAKPDVPPSVISATDNADLSSDVKIPEGDFVIIPSQENEKMEKEEELPKGYYRRLQVDESGQAVVVTFNAQRQEVERRSKESSRGELDYDPEQDCYCAGVGCSWNQEGGE